MRQDSSHPWVVQRIGALVAVLLVVSFAALPSASAVTRTGFAEWTATPVATPPPSFSGTMELPGIGAPRATWTTDSTSQDLPGGTAAWFGASSPPGQVFGSSNGHRYLVLRPVSGTVASTTTYAFAEPTPSGWGFVLGDVDADRVQISATLADGSPAPVAALGFRGVFNLCAKPGSPGQSCRAGSNDVPTWNETDATLTGHGVNTDGASAWFTPTAPLRSLTFKFSVISGSPVYQTWFASVRRDVTGTVRVTSGDCDVTATTVRLLDGDDEELASAHPDADGGYTFPGVVASDGFRVTLTDVPSGCVAQGPVSRDVDLTRDDDVANFEIRADEPGTGVVTGEVTEQGTGDPVPGAEVEITGNGVDQTSTTGVDGTYTVSVLPPGAYTATVTPPDGYEVVGSPDQELTVPPGGGPVPDVDFVLAPVAAPSPSPSPSTSASVAPPAAPSAAPSAPSGGTAVIPDTGGVALAWPVAGVGLLLAGLALVLAGRRTRRG